MASLREAKTLGGVGALLVLIGGFAGAPGGILSIVGFILVLIAIKYVADAIGNQSVFNNMIIAVVLAIIGLVAFIAIVVSALFTFIGFSNLGNLTFKQGTPLPPGFYAFIASVIFGAVIAWVFFLVSSIFLKRSYDTIGTKLNVNMFHTTGLLYMIGAATSILLVGVLLVFVAEILQIVAFFSLPEQMPAGHQPVAGTGLPP